MYNLLIVDDEQMICQGIQAMIKRKFSDTFNFYLAKDGIDALKIIQNNKIDIVITDIKMPRMDGIELIKQFHKKKPSLKFIILSGYNEFQYAREAIKYNVKDYLLKPINRAELYEILEKTIYEMEKEREEKLQFDEYVASQLNYIFVSPSIKEEEVQSICKRIGLFDDLEDGFRLFIIKFQEDVDLQRLRQELQDLASNMNDEKNTILITDYNQHFVFISNRENIFQLFNDYFNQKNYSVSLGVSSKQFSLLKLKDMYKQANHALKYHFLYPKQRIFFHEQFPEKNGTHYLKGITDDFNKIVNMLGEEQKDDNIKEILLSVFHKTFEIDEKIEYVEILNQVFKDTVIQKVLPMIEENTEKHKLVFKEFENIYLFKNFHEYKSSVETTIFVFHQKLKKVKEMEKNKIQVLKAIKFMKENFHKSINLAVVSNFVSLNYAYFSNLFKEYTGVSFVDYLKRIRVEKAKELLMDTDYKIYEISHKVGYSNPKHFTKVFREIEGISPKEYREKWLIINNSKH